MVMCECLSMDLFPISMKSNHWPKYSRLPKSWYGVISSIYITEFQSSAMKLASLLYSWLLFLQWRPWLDHKYFCQARLILLERKWSKHLCKQSLHSLLFKVKTITRPSHFCSKYFRNRTKVLCWRRRCVCHEKRSNWP